MSLNRLRLDFSLETAEERLQFLNEYLPTLNFTPNEHETETLSDYILWGKNAEGQNAQQEGIVTLKEWAPNTNVESLEGLLEVPGFQETRFQRINNTHYKSKRIVFDRDEALQRSNPEMRALFEALFQQIDEVELIINYYDLKTGKRKNPPRAALLKRFSEDELDVFRGRAAKLTPRRYLQLRHYLVELRTEQYTYRDSIQTTILPHADAQIEDQTSTTIRVDEDALILPFGLHDNSSLAQKIFQWPPAPDAFTETELKQVSHYIWAKPDPRKFSLDFRNPNHLLVLYRSYYELSNESAEDPDQIYGSAAALVRTLKFYESMARLSDLQRELLQMKVDQKTNNEIRDYINEKYKTSYNENYISTIYRQKILPTIAAAAQFHRQTMENIFYPEEFKRCKDCGRLLLRTADFFMRQKKSSDGFAPRCKECQKILREKKKENEVIKLAINGNDQ